MFKDMMVKIKGFCHPNDQEKREDSCMQTLQTLYPEGLNMERISQLKVF